MTEDNNPNVNKKLSEHEVLLGERIAKIIYDELRADPFGTRNQYATGFVVNLADKILEEVRK
jgi:hypothetical protein